MIEIPQKALEVVALAMVNGLQTRVKVDVKMVTVEINDMTNAPHRSITASWWDGSWYEGVVYISPSGSRRLRNAGDIRRLIQTGELR
jgi:hypothetical protein